MPREDIPLIDDPLWYREAIIYQLHIKAFYDSAGNGIGDFGGLSDQARLPAGTGRDRHLASPLLSLSPARRRL